MPKKYNNSNNDDMPSLILKDDHQASRLAEYNILMERLEQVSASLDFYYETDSEGRSKTLSAEDYSSIIDKYTQLQNLCRNYCEKSPAQMNAEEKARHNVVARINSYVTRDISSLSNADKNKSATLNEVISQGRTSNISVSQNNVDFDKENLKLNLKTSGGAKGAFTNENPEDYRNNLANNAIAELLGQARLYSKVSPAQLSADGKVINGVYTSVAEGEKFRNLSIKSPLANTTLDDINKANILKQLSDIQLIDFICGNPKRTADSLAYKFEKDENGKDQLTGVEVINDTVISSNNSKKAVMELDDIKYISNSSYEALKNLNKATLKTALADKMKPAEIEEVYQRVEDIKDAVKKKKINVVDKENWIIHPVTLEYIKNGGNPLYADIYTMYKEMTSKKISYIISNIKVKENLEAAVDAVIDHRIVFEGGENIEAETLEIFEGKKDSFADIKNKLDELNKITGNEPVSKEFKEMCEAINDIEEYTRLLNEKDKKYDAGITGAEYGLVQVFADNANEKRLAYIRSMEGKELSENDRKRLDFAKSLSGLSSEKEQKKDIKIAQPEENKELTDDQGMSIMPKFRKKSTN